MSTLDEYYEKTLGKRSVQRIRNSFQSPITGKLKVNRIKNGRKSFGGKDSGKTIQSRLVHSSSKKAISENIRTEMHHGKPQKQAVAIAFSEARSTKRKDHSWSAFGDKKARFKETGSTVKSTAIASRKVGHGKSHISGNTYKP